MTKRRTADTPKVDRTAETIARLKTRAEAFAADDAAWRAYLKHSARFWTYSANNQWLIWSQRPDTAEVAGYTTWQKVGRQVTKGSRGIWILAPRPFTAEEVAPNGQTVEVERVRFRAVCVFAFEDTEPAEGYAGIPYEPFRFPRLEGDIPARMFDGLADWLREQGHPVSVESIEGSGAHGWFEPKSGRIVIGAHGDPLARFGTLVHEAAHAIHFDDDSDDARAAGKAHREIVAEAAAFVAAEAVGIDTSRHAVPYIGALVSSDPAAYDTATKMIAKVARRIIDALVMIAPEPEPADVAPVAITA